MSSYDNLNLNVCENLYAAGAGAVTAPLYAYNHSAKVSTETCPTGGSSTAGVEFYDGGTFPSRVQRRAVLRRLLARLHLGRCSPAPAACLTRRPASRSSTAPRGPVDLQVGPDGDLYYADLERRHDPAHQRAGEQQRPDGERVAPRPPAAPSR